MIAWTGTANPGQNTAPIVAAPYGVFGAILALALGGLFIGTGEFVAMSLLPELAADTRVSVSAAGNCISAYAIGVVAGAPAIAIAAARVPRKTLLIALLAVVAGGNIASSLAPGSWSVMAARCLTGIPHGAYYGVACLLAATMVPARRKAQAAGYVMSGLAAANVVGVPLGTWMGQGYGWRTTFAVLGAGLLVTIVLLLRYVPATAADSDASPIRELRGLLQPRLWLTLAVASIGFAGMFSVYSYITPTLIEVTGFKAATVPLVLCVWGLGMIVGNLAGGWLADRALVPAIFGMLAWNAVFLALFTWVAPLPLATTVVLFLVGCGFALVPALQVRLMSVAGEAQTLGAALNHSAFNVSNALGAAAGGAVIATGHGWTSTGWVGSVFAVAGMVLMCLSVSGRFRQQA